MIEFATDISSGKSHGARPEIQRVLEVLADSQADVLVASEINRL